MTEPNSAAYQRHLTPEEVERHFADEAAMCLARLLDEKRTPDQHLQAVLELQVIHRLLTGFAVAQQDDAAYAKAVDERRKELENQRALEFEKMAEQRMRRSARPVG